MAPRESENLGLVTATSDAVLVPSQEEERRAYRTRQATRTSVAGVAANGLGVAVRLLSIPLSLRLLGAERYGLWLTAGSLVNWAGLADVGIGSGLVNAIGEASGRDDWKAVRRHTSTAASSLAVLAAAVLLVALGFSHWQGLSQLMGVGGRPDLSADARLLVVITGAAFAASFALSWVSSFCSGMQQGYLASIASTAGSLASLLCLFLLAGFGGTIAQFALVMGVPLVLATAGLALILFTGRYRALRPSWRLWNRESFGDVMRLGVPLFLVQLSDLAILSSANILIANRLGPAEVPRYAVPFALFSVVSRICYIVVAPYWPAYAEASGRNDWIWIRTVASRMLAVTAALMGLGGLVFLITGRAVIGWWAGSAAVPSRALLAWMSAYFFIGVCSTTTGILLTGLGLAKARMYARVPVGLAHIVGGWLLLPVLGLASIPVAGGIGFLADFAVLTPYALRHIRRCATRTQGLEVGSGALACPAVERNWLWLSARSHARTRHD